MDVSDHVESWCIRELTHWSKHSLGRELEISLAEIAETRSSFFILDVVSDRVTVRPKKIPPPWPHEPPYERVILSRLALYREHIESALLAAQRRITTIIGIDVDDHGVQSNTVPTFGYQRGYGQNRILLPDPDLLYYDLLNDGLYVDRLPYDRKQSTAVFVGSTTGGAVTRESVHNLSLPRVRSASAFRDSDLVEWRLAAIVQYDSEESAELLRATGLIGEPMSWDEQFEHKIILSVDGNGATCSRVTVALNSNSVLAKYDSTNVLHYFDSMKPWIHFVPIQSDDDVLALVTAERRCPGLLRFIASEGRSFAQEFLNRGRTLEYTGKLIACYDSLVSGSGENFQRILRSGRDRSFTLAHVANVGDLIGEIGDWVGQPGSGAALEGFLLSPVSSLPGADQLRYRAFMADLQVSDWLPARNFCGTRGHNRPISGLELMSETSPLRVEARFTDGTAATGVNTVLRGSGGAPLEAFRIDWTGAGASPKRDRATWFPWRRAAS